MARPWFSLTLKNNIKMIPKPQAAYIASDDIIIIPIDMAFSLSCA